MPERGRATIEFDGREIPCCDGLSLAAVLNGAGELELRQAGDGDTRGLFCGMGVCQECRVNVDGEVLRACMTSATDAQVVTRHARHAAPGSAAAPASAGGDHEVVEPELLVIGAGAGGLAAASVAAEAGAGVTVVDERTIPGGQFYKQPSPSASLPDSLAGDPQIAAGRSLIDWAERSGASLSLGTVVWGAFASGELAVFDGSCSRIYRPQRTVVATGAYERGLPLPGWTLPGVMTTGAAQVLLRSYGVLAGRRILVAGNGPLNLQVALEMKRAGAESVAVAELARAPGPASLMDSLSMAIAAPRLTLNGIGYLAGLKRAGVPVFFGQGLASVEQAGDALRAHIGPGDADGIEAQRALDVDRVCMGVGFQPNNEILRSLGCRHRFDDARGQLVTERNDDCETTVTGTYAVGDCCGLGGAPAAREEGVIAGCAVARSLDRALPDRIVEQERQARRDLKRHRAFQAALWRMFRAPRYQAELARPDTIICRCENVRLAELEAALADGDPSIGSVKRRTRLGMGPCQGRYCAPVTASMISRRDGVPVDEFSFFAPQSPLKPIRIADIVSTGPGQG